jgi:hypothetical protein
MPSGTGARRLVIVMPERSTPAFTKANAGRTRRRPRDAACAPGPGDGIAFGVVERNGERGDNAGESGVDAGLEAQTRGQVRWRCSVDAGDAGPVERDQHEAEGAGGGQHRQREAGGIEEGDDGDGAEIVDDGDRREESLSEAGTRAPSSRTMPSAKAMSVAAGMAQPRRAMPSWTLSRA